MGKQRKPKERDQSPKTDAVSSSSDVFKSLFGDTSAPQDAAVSIFSDTNPYRRKSQELGFAPAESLRGPDDFASEIPDLSADLKEDEKKKRKRDEKKSRKLDSDSVAEAPVTPLETKKSKKEKAQKPNLASESNGALETDKVENPNLGSESNGEENPTLGLESKKKKKRKRDELEREYEVKKYGAEKEEEKEGEKGLKEKKKVVVGEKRKTVDNVEDMMVSKEGFDDESKLLRTVFVGNLPLKTKKKVLTKEFKKFGEIESVRIRSVPILDTKKPRKEAIIMKQINEAADCVHAYIVFKTEESAQASLSHNMAAVGGNHIRVDRACPPRKKLKGEIGSLYDIKRTVFVGNLPYDVKDEEVYQLLSGIDNLGSSIEAIRVIRHPHISLGKGIAYVLFKTREAANLVVKKQNLKLRDRELRVSHARKDSTPSKRPNPSPAEAPGAPAKRLAMDHRTPESNTKASLSYQGLRASKSGVQKKVQTRSIRPGKPSNLNSKNQRGEKPPKERNGKRPSVAARKAKDRVRNDGGASRQAGIKRKLDSQTPESFQRKKKIKKFK